MNAILQPQNQTSPTTELKTQQTKERNGKEKWKWEGKKNPIYASSSYFMEPKSQ